MHTPSVSSAGCRAAQLRLTTTQALDFVDITDRVQRVVGDARLATGLVNVQTLHTTTAVLVNEHEPLLLDDLRALLSRLAPLAGGYAHDDLARRTAVPWDEPRNGHAHCRAVLLPTSVCLNVVGGRVTLGRWQRVFFVDLDGPRSRELSIVATGAAS